MKNKISLELTKEQVLFLQKCKAFNEGSSLDAQYFDKNIREVSREAISQYPDLAEIKEGDCLVVFNDEEKFCFLGVADHKTDEGFWATEAGYLIDTPCRYVFRIKDEKNITDFPSMLENSEIIQKPLSKRI